MFITAVIVMTLAAVGFIAWRTMKPVKESLKTLQHMKHTSDSIQAQMNDIKNQQTLLNEKKEYIRWDIRQKKNSFLKVKEAVKGTKMLFKRRGEHS
ncbi:hypothetical protein ACFQPF_08315 [Fictibacillus iocasae]|uniref:DUF948 domain-containing protein n=1 Tax=Fictibacillus iocasae TaxID=2715437 RepID=A0ABW2NRU2_9BACL